METIINKLQESKEFIISHDLNPDELSQKVVDMSAYLITLGGYIADLVYEANSAYIYRKFKYAFEFSQLSEMTITDKTNEATIKIKQDQQAEIEKRRIADRVKTLHEDYKLFIMTIQTRLGVLKSELFQKNLEV